MTNLKEKIFNKVTKDNTTAEREKFLKWYSKISGVIWSIAKFLVTYWLFNRIYNRIGFEKTIIMILAILLISLWGALKEFKM